MLKFVLLMGPYYLPPAVIWIARFVQHKAFCGTTFKVAAEEANREMVRTAALMFSVFLMQLLAAHILKGWQ